MDRERYQQLVGRLIYLSHTRLDIAFVVSMVSQYMHSPKESHLEAEFKKSVEFGMTWPSRISLDTDRDESDTRYILYLDSALNRLDSDDLTDIPS